MQEFVTTMMVAAFEELHSTAPDEHEFEVFATWLWIKRGCPTASPRTLFG